MNELSIISLFRGTHVDALTRQLFEFGAPTRAYYSMSRIDIDKHAPQSF